MGNWSVLVADELSAEGLDVLAQLGDVVVKSGMSEDELRESLPGVHALAVRSATTVTARSLELADQLTVIGRAGIGVDNIDVTAATERGIVVMNAPEATAVTTGELAIALVMSLARSIPAADAATKRGEWIKGSVVGTELRGKTLGVLGLGRIGTVVADRGSALRMEVIAHDPYVPAEHVPPGVRQVTLDELLAQSDFLSVHVPLTRETNGLIDAGRLAEMKHGAYLINAARGGIVDEEALCDALNSEHLAGAALDVFSREPLPPDSRLLTARNLILTPHIGASTKEAKHSVSVDIARQIRACLKRGVVLNGVNVRSLPAGLEMQLAPFVQLATNLASFTTKLFTGRLESVRLTLQGELLAAGADALAVAALAGALRAVSEAPVTVVNAERVAEHAGVQIHTETATLKRDVVNLLRIEVSIDGTRHLVSGTVLGHRHGRMVELDEFLMDAIPEGPMLVTFHRDRPGVIGSIGTILGASNVNISRMQLGIDDKTPGQAVGILNLDAMPQQEAIDSIRRVSGVLSVHTLDV